MTWVDLSSAFGFGTKLTSTQMQNLRDNITAMANGDSGAPSIQNAAMDTDSVDTAQIVSSAVDTAELAADAVTGAKIEDDAVDTEHIATNAVEALQLATSSVTQNKIDADAVVASKILDGVITALKFQDGASQGQLLFDQAYSSDGSTSYNILYNTVSFPAALDIYIPADSADLNIYVFMDKNGTSGTSSVKAQIGGSVDSSVVNFTNTSYEWKLLTFTAAQLNSYDDTIQRIEILAKTSVADQEFIQGLCWFWSAP